MGGLVFYLVGLWLGSAFAPDAIARHLAAAGHLPLEFACEEEHELAVAVHYRRDGARASYVPAAPQTPDRLALYAPFYLRGLALVPVVEMPVDVCEGYFNALLQAHLRRQLGRPASEVGWQIRQQAPLAMPDVPRAQQVEAYLDALASFGSHVLSVANELERKEVQRRGRGGLCPLLGRQLPLMRLWERMFATDGYPGAYVDAGGRVRFSRAVLRPEDKRFVVEQVLRSPWRGSVAADHAPRYCKG
jgi:hypothetical protein